MLPLAMKQLGELFNHIYDNTAYLENRYESSRQISNFARRRVVDGFAGIDSDKILGGAYSIVHSHKNSQPLAKSGAKRNQLETTCFS